MTNKFRLDAIRLETTNGRIDYDFPSDLTVLAGRTGVGKTTLLELVKFGLGGNGLLADVVREHVNDVILDVTIGNSRLRILRSVDPNKAKTARVFDLITQERLPDCFIDAGRHPSLNSLLLNSLGLPDDMHAAAQGASSRQGTRISFSDIFSYMYIPQSAINRDIAHSTESYREPTRKAVFELLFGLTDPEILGLRSQVNLLSGTIKEAEKEHDTVLVFLRDSNTARREEADQAMARAVAAQESAAVELDALRNAIDPVTDRETQALRDLLAEAERGLSDARDMATDLIRQQAEYTGERRRVQGDTNRLLRMREAGDRLASIEFLVCPRCMQSLTDRDVPQQSCRVCLQPDPVADLATDGYNTYELTQLFDQLQEMDDQIEAIARQLEVASQAITDRQSLVQSLSEKLDARTAERITPRLQAFTDAAALLASARIQQEQFEQILRQWDRADDLGAVVEQLSAQQQRLRMAIQDRQDSVQARRTEILESISEEFQAAVLSLGIPGVESASIHPTTYLPLLNGQLFTTFSPAGGGIFTATQVAYWTSLLTVALRDSGTPYPAFLLIDSPRLALNTSEDLSAALYRRLVTQADANPGRVQLIIADNELPAGYRRDFAQLDFTYEAPTVRTIRHPGPAAVKPISGSRDDAESG